MLKLFTITDVLQNNNSSKDLLVKNILANKYIKFESNGDNFETVLTSGQSEIPIHVATLNIAENKIILTSSYENTIKILIKLGIVLALTSTLLLLYLYFSQFIINKNLQIILIIYPILTVVMFLVSRIALYIKRNELIDELKKSNLICTKP